MSVKHVNRLCDLTMCKCFDLIHIFISIYHINYVTNRINQHKGVIVFVILYIKGSGRIQLIWSMLSQYMVYVR